MSTSFSETLADWSNFGGQWMKTGCTSSNGWCAGADRDGPVTINDLNAFVEGWLLDAE